MISRFSFSRSRGAGSWSSCAYRRGALGAGALAQLPIDAVPDITNNQVQINTIAPALSPDEVESRSPFRSRRRWRASRAERRARFRATASPRSRRSSRDETDIYFARQQVNERLLETARQLPPGAEPTMGRSPPAWRGLHVDRQLAIGATAKDGEPGSQRDGSYLTPEGERLRTEFERATYLRTVQDWIIRPQLKSVKGVAGVDAIGGYVKQYQVQPDPAKLVALGLTFGDVVEALEANNVSRGAGYLERKAKACRARRRPARTSRSSATPCDTRGGVPVRVSDVAGSRSAASPHRQRQRERPRGRGRHRPDADRREQPHGRRRGRRANQQIATIAAAGYRRQAGARPHAAGRRDDRDRRANLAEGALLVIAVLFLLLGNFRAALITALVIPLSCC